MSFIAIEEPSVELLVTTAATAPWNPFYAPGYVRARVEVGRVRPVLLALQRDDGTLLSGCPAYLSEGRWTWALEIESLPSLPAESEAFWTGLQRWCRSRRIGALRVGTFASEPAPIPRLGAEAQRQARTEHVLDLETYSDEPAHPSSQYKRNLKRGRKAGVTIRSTRDPVALRDHTRLMAASMQRRQDRGEAVHEVVESSWSQYEPYLRTRAAELFQAEREGTVVSSLFILLAERGAYYQSAGTSPDGMACGASPFLVHETACQLRRRSLQRFNLGGAHASEAGLYRFKSEFGGRLVALESAYFDLNPPLIRTARSFMNVLRRIRK
jgi:lipid II:glycine glycyltransferase (peptidoglycan interpeptide bridge formation enzyme)